MNLHPDFPQVVGHFPMPQGWSIELPQACNRRIENGDLVLWRDGFTAWLAIWHNDKNESAAQRLAWIKAKQPSEAQDVLEQQAGELLLYRYSIVEEEEDEESAELTPVHAVYAFAFAPDSHIDIAMYCDDAAEVAKAMTLLASLRCQA